MSDQSGADPVATADYLMTPQVRTLRLDEIVADPDIQPRADIPEGGAEEYRDLLDQSVTLPPLEVTYDGRVYYLVEGFTRRDAMLLRGDTEAECRVTSGSYQDAKIRALASNATHGYRRTIRDKEKNVRTALAEPRFQGATDRVIAATCQVHRDYVAKVRAKVEREQNPPPIEAVPAPMVEVPAPVVAESKDTARGLLVEVLAWVDDPGHPDDSWSELVARIRALLGDK